jgi:cell fate (sporulation/competence/biofilm development) regulator YlbF (YheA/YmcA/DUF963 family)
MLSTASQDPALAAATAAAEIGALTAGAAFGAALRATPEFAALTTAGRALDADPAARSAIHAYNERREDLGVEAAMDLLAAEQSDEIARLLDEMYAVPSVIAYVNATTDFGDLCKEAAAVVSGLIGIDFAANSRSGGCCGG